MNSAEIVEILDSLDDMVEVDRLLEGSFSGLWQDKIEDFFKAAGYEGAEYLASGAYRHVYRAGNVVIKVANSVDGRCCNEFEVRFFNDFSHQKQRAHLPTFHWHSKNYWLVIWEFVEGEREFDTAEYKVGYPNKPDHKYFDLFPSWMTSDWHAGNIIVRPSGMPVVVDFTANDYCYDVEQTMQNFNETGEWEPITISAGQLRYPARNYTFVKLTGTTKGCVFGYVVHKYKANEGYDCYLIYDDNQGGSHNFNWLTRIKGFKEEPVFVTLAPNVIEGEVNAQSLFEYLLEDAPFDI